ncbi:MAG: hypothetical protein AAGJ28_27095, partial [Pseudomonadota bacterium]
MFPVNLVPNQQPHEESGMTAPMPMAPVPQGLKERFMAGLGRGPAAQYYEQRGMVDPYAARGGAAWTNLMNLGTGRPMADPSIAYQQAIADNAITLERRRTRDPFYEYEEGRRRGIIPEDMSYADFQQMGFRPLTSSRPRFSARTEIFDDGTTLSIDTQGNRVVMTPDGRQLAGDEAQQALSSAIQSGVRLQGDRSDARRTGLLDANRREEVVNTGITAARSLPTLKRTQQLLRELETGGFSAVGTRIRQFLGIEGADERELTTNMARAVLAQLKSIFGAQFTAQEGERLERIEPQIGNSTEGNRRLIDQMIRLGEFRAQRAINAARQEGDFFSIQEIQEYLDFDLGDGT